MTFSLSTLRHNGKPTPVIEAQGRYYPLTSLAPELLQAAPSRGLMNLFDDWASAEAALLKLAARLETSHDGALVPAPDDFMTPLQYPNKLILGGANYYEHMHKDAKMPDFRKENAIPVFFLKAPTTSLVGSGKTVRYPTQSKKVDWEVELALGDRQTGASHFRSRRFERGRRVCRRHRSICSRLAIPSEASVQVRSVWREDIR
jgi:hypothetical protein